MICGCRRRTTALLAVILTCIALADDAQEQQIRQRFGVSDSSR